MDDPPRQGWIEKRMGHEAYARKRNWGLIAIGLVLFVAVCGLLLFLAAWAKLIR
jgi:hypothetical protein